MDEDQIVVNESEQNEPEVTEGNLLNQILKAAGHDIPDEEPASEDNSTEEIKEAEQPVEEPKEEVTEQKPEEKKDDFYTLEELVEMGKSESFDKINTAKIPPELQAVTKSLQAMATRRQQSLADKEKQLDELITRNGQKPVDNPAPAQVNLDQLALMNPGAAMQQIQGELKELDAKLKEADETDNFFEVQKLLLKEKELRDRERQIGEHYNRVQNTWTEIRSAVPDLDTKAPKITEYVLGFLKDDPLTPEEIDALTNPGIMGRTAGKVIKLFNGLYDQAQQFAQAKQTVEEKLKKAAPSPSVRAGTVEQSSTNKTNLTQLKKRAQESGDPDDWAAYIAESTKK